MSTTRNVAAIENGTVIDHIDPKTTFDVFKILGEHNEMVVVGNNFSSGKINKKGIIKVWNKELTKKQLNTIALLSPQACASVIKNFQVVEKIPLSMPDEFVGILRCPNPSCITRHEPITTSFTVKDKKLKCHYCERLFDRNEMELI